MRGGPRPRQGTASLAAALAAEMAAVLAGRGRTLADELDQIAREYGLYVSAQHNVVRKGTDGVAAIRGMMKKLRNLSRSDLAALGPSAVTDYEARSRTDLRTGASSGVSLPQSDVLVFELESGSRVVARPSGTEPKAKFYFDVREEVGPGEPVEQARTRALAALGRLKDAFLALLE